MIPSKVLNICSFFTSNSFKEEEIVPLCKQVGAKLKLQTEFIDKFAQLVLSNPLSNEYERQLNQLSKDISPEMVKSLQKMRHRLKTHAVAHKTLSSLLEQVTIREKWKDLNLNPEWLDNYSQDVKFLVTTKLIYSILGFQNSSVNGLKENEMKIQNIPGTKQTGIWIKKEGQWVSISQIQQSLLWNSKERVLVSKQNPSEKWSYFSSDGLLPIATAYEYHLESQATYPKQNKEMHSVTKLSKKEMDSLLAHAKHFCEGAQGAAIDPSKITCAMQFFTQPDLPFKQPYLQNLNAQLKVHCGIRLIMSDGSLYSFGFGGDFQEHLLKSKTSSCIATINGQPKILDYQEFHKYKQCVVTTVPLDDSQAKDILEHLNLYRARGIRFNVLKQNCVRFGTHLLHLAGITVNTRISLGSVFWRSLPNLKQIPVVGKPLHLIKKVSQRISQTAGNIIPTIVKDIFAYLGKIVFYLPNQLAVLFFNLGLLAFGGQKASPNSSLSLEKTISGNLENFDRLVAHLFDPEAAYVHHSSIFINWQLKQKTTEVYRYSGQPKMHILPPKSRAEKEFSHQKKIQLKAVYQESAEVV